MSKTDGSSEQMTGLSALFKERNAVLGVQMGHKNVIILPSFTFNFMGYGFEEGLIAAQI